MFFFGVLFAFFMLLVAAPLYALFEVGLLLARVLE
jgi:Sec-independent protein secretion pathway component TatC